MSAITHQGGNLILQPGLSAANSALEKAMAAAGPPLLTRDPYTMTTLKLGNRALPYHFWDARRAGAPQWLTGRRHS
jgi:hypothetical protein